MKKFEYKKIRGDELIGVWSKNFYKGEKGWDDLVKRDIEIECGIATRDYTKYQNREDVDESIKNSVTKATEFALNELGEEGWELVSVETIKPSGFDIVRPATNKMYNFKREKK